MIQSDGQSTNLTASGVIFGGPARIMGIYFVSTAVAGSVVIKDGGSGGTTLATFDSPASATHTAYIDLSRSPLRCQTSAYATISDVSSVTVIYA